MKVNELNLNKEKHLPVGEDKLKDRIRKSLRSSFLEGSFRSMMVGFGESFLSAFAIFLKANNVQIGLLGSLPQALGSLSQLFSNRLMKIFNSRKKLVCIASLLEGLIYIPIALVFFLGDLKIVYLISFICLYWIFGMILGHAWNSWIGELVHEKKRGLYFGRRNKIGGFATLVSLLIGGYILQRFTNGTKTQYIGFAIIFGLALISRMISFIFLFRQYEPRYKVDEEEHVSFWQFIKQINSKNFGLLVLYLCFMNVGVFLAGPFFVPFMLKDLKLGYMTFTIVNAVAMVAKFLSMPVWGHASDRFGTRKVLSLAAYLMPLTPLLWLFSQNLIYILLIQAFAGFAWAGFEITSFSFIFDTTSAKNRATYIAYYNVLNSFAIILGAVIGGYIVRHNNLFWSKYLFVFVLSCGLRYLASLIFIPKLKEVREVEHIPYHKLLLNIITTMPTMGLMYDLVTIRKKNKFIRRNP